MHHKSKLARKALQELIYSKSVINRYNLAQLTKI